MKRIGIILVIVAMFAWAVYDFVLPKEHELTQDEGQAVDESKSSAGVEESADKASAEEKKDVTGLERGQLAPDFELELMDGEKVRLSDYYGRPIMLNFWASWCAPCRAEIPDMIKFYDDKDVEVVAVNLTNTEHSMEVVADFVEEFEMNFPILLDRQGAASTIYGIQPIPTTFLLDEEGYIYNIAYGPLNYDLMVQAYEDILAQ